jgi:hypothetical protein
MQPKAVQIVIHKPPQQEIPIPECDHPKLPQAILVSASKPESAIKVYDQSCTMTLAVAPDSPGRGVFCYNLCLAAQQPLSPGSSRSMPRISGPLSPPVWLAPQAKPPVHARLGPMAVCCAGVPVRVEVRHALERLRDLCPQTSLGSCTHTSVQHIHCSQDSSVTTVLHNACGCSNIDMSMLTPKHM